MCLYSITGKAIYRRGDADVIPTDGSEPSVTHLAHTHLMQVPFITLCRFEEVFQLLEFIHETAGWCIAESQIYPSSPPPSSSSACTQTRLAATSRISEFYRRFQVGNLTSPFDCLPRVPPTPSAERIVPVAEKVRWKLGDAVCQGGLCAKRHVPCYV